MKPSQSQAVLFLLWKVFFTSLTAQNPQQQQPQQPRRTRPQHPRVSVVAACTEAQAAAEKSGAETASDCGAESRGGAVWRLLLGAVEGAGVHGAVPAAASALRVPRMRSASASNLAGAEGKIGSGRPRHEAHNATRDKATASKSFEGKANYQLV